MIHTRSKNVILKCHEISYVAGRGPILENISFELHCGEILTIIGPNGGGKTTLAKIIIGSLKPSKGNLEILSGIRVGYMPQMVNLSSLMPLTVKSFLLLGLGDKEVKPEILEENKVKKILYKQLYNLSGGELQKVLFTKVLLNDPDLLILDEPTQGLDISGQDDFYKQISILRQLYSKTILMISHDLHTVMRASDKIICLNRHIHCSGKPADVSGHSSYKNMFFQGQNTVMYAHKDHGQCNHD